MSDGLLVRTSKDSVQVSKVRPCSACLSDSDDRDWKPVAVFRGFFGKRDDLTLCAKHLRELAKRTEKL